MAAVVGLLVGVVVGSGIGEDVLAALAGVGVAVSMGIHHVASYAEYLLFPYGEVHAEVLRVVDALVSPEAAEARAVAVSEA